MSTRKCGYCNQPGHRIDRCNSPEGLGKIEEIKSYCNVLFNICHFSEVSYETIKHHICYYLSGITLKVKYVNGVEENAPRIAFKDIKLLAYSMGLRITPRNELLNIITNVIFQLCNISPSYILVVESYTMQMMRVVITNELRRYMQTQQYNVNLPLPRVPVGVPTRVPAPARVRVLPPAQIRTRRVQVPTPARVPVPSPPPRIIPTIVEKQKNAFVSKTYECCICYNTFKDNYNKIVTKCNHEFCRNCFISMIEYSRNGVLSCPMCRNNVTEITTTKTSPDNADIIYNNIYSFVSWLLPMT